MSMIRLQGAGEGCGKDVTPPCSSFYSRVATSAGQACRGVRGGFNFCCCEHVAGVVEAGLRRGRRRWCKQVLRGGGVAGEGVVAAAGEEGSTCEACVRRLASRAAGGRVRPGGDDDSASFRPQRHSRSGHSSLSSFAMDTWA
ncbi:hypothetical protein E2C01_068467 [Portunus trituberculatus]|uniref:Uncharacterized protein n=1 Tax=Portunus trituberculatus TaxID=210409 RepID=A0A5B7HWI5_PORTR|nr:hypothetical protein [Portunus trituberculatus]